MAYVRACGYWRRSSSLTCKNEHQNEQTAATQTLPWVVAYALRKQWRPRDLAALGSCQSRNGFLMVTWPLTTLSLPGERQEANGAESTNFTTAAPDLYWQHGVFVRQPHLSTRSLLPVGSRQKRQNDPNPVWPAPVITSSGPAASPTMRWRIVVFCLEKLKHCCVLCLRCWGFGGSCCKTQEGCSGKG